jgi:hypothetical protein
MKSKRRWLLALAVVPVVLVLVEVAFRVLAPALGVDGAELARLRAYALDGTVPFYEPRPHTIYALNTTGPGSNSYGFPDEEWKRERTPGVLRIACLGASTTEGGNVLGQLGAYPHFLEELLEDRTGREFDVMNCGVSGWTTAESLVAWFLCLQDFRPDLVIVHHAANDASPRLLSGYRPDYTHYRKPWEVRRATGLRRWLLRWSDVYAWRTARAATPTILEITTRQGVNVPWSQGDPLPPGTDGAFRRNLASIGEGARSIGADVCLLTMPTRPLEDPPRPELAAFRTAIAEHNAIARELAAERGWMLADAATLPGDPEELAPLFVDLVHLEPEGNRSKALVALEVLGDEWLPRVLAR